MDKERYVTFKVAQLLKDKGFDCGDGLDEVSFAWNEGEIV